MEFDSNYQVQQIPARTRNEKVISVDRDAIEKHRLEMRHENFERHHPIADPVKPVPEASYAIDDVERFNRDICAEQRAYKQATHDMIWKRAAHRHLQQEEYQKQIETRRRMEEEEAKKRADISGAHDFNEESVCYDPITNVVPDATTKKGSTQLQLDSQMLMRREARAKRIYHASNSTMYNPITGEVREHW